MLSYLSRWARVALSVRSFAADQLDVGARGEHRPEEVAADAAEAVDANPDGHRSHLLVCAPARPAGGRYVLTCRARQHLHT